MTLVLTAASPYWVVQLSDRLVSINTNGRTDVYDPVANKTIVYRATDALVSIGYSGIAYVGNMPTDEWLAEILWGARLMRGFDGERPAMTFGGPLHRRDMGRSIINIRRAIESLPVASGVDRYGLFLTIAGWQRHRHRFRPIVVEITRFAGATKVERAPRHWSAGDTFRIHSIGANIDAAALRAGYEQFRTPRGLIHCSPVQIEAVLANTIRSISATNASVGSHILSTILVRPDLGTSGCRFLPMTPHLAQVSTARGNWTLPVAHTPRIVGAGMLHPPSLEIGTQQILLGGIPFVIEGAPPQGGFLGLSSSVRRRSPPMVKRKPRLI
ncbi:MAG: hypothetical protein WDN03_00240 [Rhizomicrobium sp.]